MREDKCKRRCTIWETIHAINFPVLNQRTSKSLQTFIKPDLYFCVGSMQIPMF